MKHRVVPLTLFIVFLALSGLIFNYLTGQKVPISVNAIDVVIETDKDTYQLGENFTASVYLYNPYDKAVYLYPIYECSFNGASEYDPSPISCIVNIDYVSGALIKIEAKSRIMFLDQMFKPEYPGRFIITCLGATHVVNITGVKWITLDSPGISLVAHTNQTSVTQGDNVWIYLSIRNANSYPVKVPLFDEFKVGSCESDSKSITISWAVPYFTVDANSTKTIWVGVFGAREQGLEICFCIDGHQVNFSTEIKPP